MIDEKPALRDGPISMFVWKLVDQTPWVGRLAMAAMLAVVVVVYARAVRTPPIDFGAYYSAANALRQGQSPYQDALIWKDTGYAVGSPQPIPTANSAYVYPLPLAMALVPLTALPILQASAIWIAFLFVCVLTTAWCLATLVVAEGGSRFWLVFAALALSLVIFKPVRGALTFSKQVDPIVMVLLALMLVAFVRRRDGWTALWFGLAIAIKPFVVVLALLLLWKSAYRAVIGAGVLSAVLVIGPLVAFGLLGDFTSVSSYWSGTNMAASPVSQSSYSFLLRTLTVQPYTVPLVEAPWLVTPLRVLIGVGLVIGMLRVVSRSRREPVGILALEFGLAVVAMLIFGPLTEEHHLSYLAIGLTATIAAVLPGWQTSTQARWISAVTALLLVFFVLPGTQDLAWGFASYTVDGPMRFPISLVTYLFFYALSIAAAVNVLALGWLRQHASPRQETLPAGTGAGPSPAMVTSAGS